MNTKFEGKTAEDAVRIASETLGLSADRFTYTVTDAGSKGFLGIGARNAVIEVTVPDDPETFLSGYLKEFFSKLGVENYSEKITVGNEKNIDIQLDGEELAVYTERNTDIVDSLQFILAVTLNKKFDDHYKITFNINDYKEKSVSRIEALAVKNAKQVQKTRRKVILFPMTAYQRRIVHSKLQDFENITTYSVGTEPDRKVVIAYKFPEGEEPAQQDRRPSRPRNGGRNGYARRERAAEENKVTESTAEETEQNMTENTEAAEEGSRPEYRSEKRSYNGRYSNNSGRQGQNRSSGRRFEGGNGGRRDGRRSYSDASSAPAQPAQPKIKQLYPRPAEDDGAFGSDNN